MHYHRRPRWTIRENLVTEEDIFLNRRKVLAGMGLSAGLLMTGTKTHAAPEDPFTPTAVLNPDFAEAGRAVTDEAITSQYNNFYEFGSSKRIAGEAQNLSTDGWTIAIDGLVDTPKTLGVEDILKQVNVEERIVRHRCVEAWSMVVPWIGFPISDLIALANPTSDAKYVRFETFMDTDVSREQRASWYPWPYVEGFTMAEAMNPLAFMVVGAYGKELHKQFGAPMRVHMPWKYGFKSIKSIVKMSFTNERPVGFWEALQDKEYGFWANVNPEVSHPRWSQATEQPLAGGARIPTLPYNGYAEEVAGLYTGLDAEFGDALYR